jgi:cohesin complex subunit SCC1
VGDILGATDVTRDESGFDFGADDGGLDLTAAGLDVSASDIAAEQSLSLDDMTPRTKQQVTEAAEKRAADAAAKAAKDRKQLEDRVTELDGAGINALGKRNVDDILTEEQYLPRSRAYAALLSIHNDPAAHFGSLSRGSMSNLFAGSDLDLAPELNNLFVIDLDAHRAAKRARSTPEDDLSVEVGRRAAPEEEDQVDFGFGDETLGLGGGEGLDMPTLDDTMPALDITADESGLRKSQRIQARADEDEAVGGDSTLSQTGILAPLSRLGTPEMPEDVNLETESFTPTSSRLLAAFDTRPSDVETAALAAAEDANATQAASAQGWSKNTVRAQRVIRSQLNRDDEDSELRLDQVGANASRRAAAGFFFELLVLGTKDQVELKQDEPYGDIVIKGKAGLWA